MSTNWQDVPRDPIADDDELEYLYRLAEVNKIISTGDRTAFVSSQSQTPEQPKDGRKLPHRSGKDLVPEKLACIAFLTLIFPLGLVSSLHLV